MANIDTTVPGSIDAETSNTIAAEDQDTVAGLRPVSGETNASGTALPEDGTIVDKLAGSDQIEDREKQYPGD